jgi:cytochrome b
MNNVDYSYPLYAKLIHLGVAGFGVVAFLTGEFAEGSITSVGYLLHAYLGLSLAVFICLRLLAGAARQGPLRFAGWSPLSQRQWIRCREDIRSLLRGKVPERGMHEGLAGITQAFGILIFAWMGATGTVLYLLRSVTGSGPFEAVAEVHELGEALIPLYLTLHVGSVIVHSLAGNPIWKRMWNFGGSKSPRPAGHLHSP